MLWTWPVGKGKLKELNDLFFYAFQVWHFSAFKWLYNCSKCLPNGAKMAIFDEKSQKSLSGWRLCPQIPVYDMLKLHWFAPHSDQMKYFLNKDILTFGSRPRALANFWLSLWFCCFSSCFTLKHLPVRRPIFHKVTIRVKLKASQNRRNWFFKHEMISSKLIR